MTPAFDRARAALLQEAQRARPASWRKTAGLTAASLIALLALIAVGGMFAGVVSTQLLVLHATAMTPVLVAAVLACFSAFVPGGRRVRLAAIALSFSSALMLVVARVQSHPPESPGWVCTVSHLGVAVLPAMVTLLSLRRAAWTLLRALAGGLAVGATGAFVGELVCEQSALHVLLFHLPAWGLSTAVVIFVSSRLTPRSFAP